MFKIILILFMFFPVWFPAFAATPSTGEAQNTPELITVIGTSRIQDGDIVKARDWAISNGLFVAVSKKSIELINSEDIAKNFKEICEFLHSRTGDFIRTYRLMGEAVTGDVYRVMMQVTVSSDTLKDQLSGIRSPAPLTNLPRILFFIAEKQIGDSEFRYWWSKEGAVQSSCEAGIAKIMAEKGYIIIPHEIGIISEIEMNGGADVNTFNAVNIGIQLQADIVIIGKADVSLSMNTMGNTRSFSSTVKARAYTTDTGEEIALCDQTAVVINADDAIGSKESLTAAGVSAGRELDLKIADAWKNHIKRTNMLDLVVSGIQNLGNFVKFRRTLSELPGVKDIQIREMQSDETVIVVDYENTAQDLANSLMLKTFTTFGVNVHEIKPNQLRIELVPK